LLVATGKHNKFITVRLNRNRRKIQLETHLEITLSSDDMVHSGSAETVMETRRKDKQSNNKKAPEGMVAIFWLLYEASALREGNAWWGQTLPSRR
jgi:hypothetical protein